jgi:catechol 2,3-dioxygenase-like lactoylglutathione lyase family enzyme
MKSLLRALPVVCATVLCQVSAWAEAPAEPRAVVGLDHIPLVVSDLEKATASYLALGFALKSGRAHANGIRNAHIKYRDGAGIELLMPSESRDELNQQYVARLRLGEGPVFFALHAADAELTPVMASLKSVSEPFTQEGNMLTLAAPELADVFFIDSNRSPTDRPEHFAHRNASTALIALWIATPERARMLRLLSALGASVSDQEVFAPLKTAAVVARVANGDVYLLPESAQTVQGRAIVGATLLTAGLANVRAMVRANKIEGTIEARGRDYRSVFIPPRATHGIWLEFRSYESSATKQKN